MTDFQGLINKAIKELRLKTGLSQEKFSEKCGISVDVYRNIEHNRYTPKSITIDKICEAFNLTPIDLLHYAYKNNNNKAKLITERVVGLDNKQIDLILEFISLFKRV